MSEADQDGADNFNLGGDLDFEIVGFIGHGTYGHVYLARGKNGVFYAVKVIYRVSFEDERSYEREYKGILEFEPVSRQSESQLQLVHVGRHVEAGRYYYIMELAGGNLVTYKKKPLHTFWDHLPDSTAHKDINAYATTLIKGRDQMPKAQRDVFNAKAKDLNPSHWVTEGQRLIHDIGYPPSAAGEAKVYEQKAHRTADYQLLLGGARLAAVLERDLPAVQH